MGVARRRSDAGDHPRRRSFCPTGLFRTRLQIHQILVESMKTYDVVIVGSGAAGGTLAAHLARAGVDVAVVEGGPKINTRSDFNTHAMPWEFANRQIPRMRPGKDGMASERARGLGGKSLTWNAVAWRQSHRDFKGKSIEG